jgi:hypothetical protein
MAMPAANEPGPIQLRPDPVGGVPRWLFIAIAVVIGGFGVALVKPWGGTPPDGGVSNAPTFGQPLPSPTSEAQGVIEAAQLRALCNQPADWRLITMETGALGDTRTMFGLTAAAATGPTDSSIPTAHLNATLVFGIGVCSPHAGANPTLPSPVIGVTIWNVPPAGDASKMLPAPVLDDALNNLGEAYFGRPRTETDPLLAGNDNHGWPPGRYAIQIDRGDANGTTLWFALEFERH